MGRSVTVFRVCRVPGMIVQYRFKLCNIVGTVRIVYPFIICVADSNTINLCSVFVEPTSPLANG